MVIFVGKRGSIGGYGGKCVLANDDLAIFDFDKFGRVDFVSNMGRNARVTVELYSEYGYYFCSTAVCGGFKNWISSKGKVTLNEHPVVIDARIEVSPSNGQNGEEVYVSVFGAEGASVALYQRPDVSEIKRKIGTGIIEGGVALFIRSFAESVSLFAVVDGVPTSNSAHFTITVDSGYDVLPDEEESEYKGGEIFPQLYVEPETIYLGESVTLTVKGGKNMLVGVWKIAGQKDTLIISGDDILIKKGRTDKRSLLSGQESWTYTPKERSEELYGDYLHIAARSYTGQTGVVKLTVLDPVTGAEIEAGVPTEDEAAGISPLSRVEGMMEMVLKFIPIIIILYLVNIFRVFLPKGR